MTTVKKIYGRMSHGVTVVSASLVKMSACIAVLACVVLGSCAEDEAGYDPYYNWAARNEAWYMQKADSARSAIGEAKAKYGEDWESHCEWRMFKSLLRSQSFNSGNVMDSICVRVRESGVRSENTLSPLYADTVRLSYRGFLMPAEYMDDNGTIATSQKVFSQTFYGNYDAAIAAPTLLKVSGTVEGFSTALQYMVPGDVWDVYIPQALAYGGSTSNSDIPAYSTLLFRIYLTAVYRAGSGVPEWK